MRYLLTNHILCEKNNHGFIKNEKGKQESIAIRFDNINKSPIIPVKSTAVIGNRRVEGDVVRTDETGKRKVERLDSLDNHFGNLISTIGVEVSVVLKGRSLVRVRAWRIMDKGALAILHAKGLIEGTGHVLKFDELHTEVFSHPSHGFWIVGMSVLHLAILIKGATLGRGDEDGGDLSGTSLIHKLLESIGKVVECPTTRSLLLFFIMSKLHKKIVSRFHQGEDFLQSSSSNEGGGGLTTLSIVGYSHLISQPTRKHLSPRSPRLIVLVYHRGITTKPEGWDIIGCFYTDRRYRRRIPIHLNGEFIIPVHLGLFTFLDTHTIGLAIRKLNDSIAFVDNEGSGLELPLFGLEILYKEATSLSAQGGVSLLLPRPYSDSHLVVAIWNTYGEIVDSIRKTVSFILSLPCFCYHILKVIAITFGFGIHIFCFHLNGRLFSAIK